MKILKIIALIISLTIAKPAFCEPKYDKLFAGTNSCFLVYDLNKKQNIFEYGVSCDEKMSPASSFNVALSIMGYDLEVLNDEFDPVYEFKNGYIDFVESWRKSHNPTTWMKDSVIWYAQVLALEIGIDNIKKYLAKFNYGNQDLSGYSGKQDSLSDLWLNSSLKISTKEQLDFIAKFAGKNLEVSNHAMEMTKKIIYNEDIGFGFKLYGKTGTIPFYTLDSKIDYTRPQTGWYIGFVEKDNKAYAFALSIQDRQLFNDHISKRAKEIAKKMLIEIGILN